MTGFEPAAPSSRTKCATKLRYIPIKLLYYVPLQLTDWIPSASEIVTKPDNQVNLVLKPDDERGPISFRARQKRLVENTPEPNPPFLFSLNDL